MQCGWGCEALRYLQDVHRIWFRWALQPVLIAERVSPPLPTHIPDSTQQAAECNPGLARSQPAAQLRHTSMPSWWHFPKASPLVRRAHQDGHCCQAQTTYRLVSPPYKKKSLTVSVLTFGNVTILHWHEITANNNKKTLNNTHWKCFANIFGADVIFSQSI